MNKNLLIVGAGIYGLVVKEIAESMGCFEKIDFVDDERKTTPNGIDVIGTMRDIGKIANYYDNVVVAIGNPKIRLSLLNRIKEETSCRVVSIVSPEAYVSPSAQIMDGCIIEPMAVVHTYCVLCCGCIVSSGAVINHATMCSEGVHADCNATVEGYCLVPAGTKICSGEVYRRKNTVNMNDTSFDPQKWTEYLIDISQHMLEEV